MFTMETYNFNEEDKFSISKSGAQLDIAGLPMQCRGATQHGLRGAAARNTDLCLITRN